MKHTVLCMKILAMSTRLLTKSSLLATLTGAIFKLKMGAKCINARR